MKKNIRRGIIIQASLLIVCIITTTALFIPVQRNVERYMERIKTSLITSLEARLGRSISYRTISPSIFKFIEIRDLSVYSEQGELISIDRLRLHFRISHIFSENPADALRRITIRNGSFTIDYERDEDILVLLSNLFNDRGRSVFKVTGRNIKVTARLPEQSVEIRDVFFSFNPEGMRPSFQFRGFASYNRSSPVAGLSTVQSDLLIRGYFGESLTSADIRVRLNDVHTNLLSINKLTLQAVIGQPIVEIRKIQDRSPFDLLFRYDRITGDLELSIATDHFVPSRYITLGEGFKRFDGFLDSTLTMNVTVTYNGGADALSYTGYLESNLVIPQIRGGVQVSTRFSGTPGVVTVSDLRASSDYGNGDFSGSIDLTSFYPEGVLTLSDVNLGKGHLLSGRFSISSRLSALFFSSNRIDFGTVSLENAEIRLEPNAGDFDFSVLADFPYQGSDGTIRMEGNMQVQPDLLIQASLETENSSLKGMISSLGLSDTIPFPRIVDTMILNSRILFNTDLKKTSFVAPYVEIRDRTDPMNYITLGAAGNNRSIEIFDFTVEWNDYFAEGYFTSSISKKRGFEFSTSLYLQGTPYNFEGVYIPEQTFIVQGSYNFDISLMFTRRRILFRLICEDLPIPLPAETTYLSIITKGVFIDRNTWEILVQESRLRNIPFLKRENAELTLAARITEDGGNIFALSFSDSISTIEGNGSVNFLFPPDYALSGWVQLYNTESDESYEARFRFNRSLVSADIDFTGSPVSRFTELPVTGYVGGNAHVEGPPGDVSISADIAMRAGRFNNDPFSLDSSIVYTPRMLSIESLTMTFLNARVSNGRGTVDFENRSLDFQTAVQGLFRRAPLSGELHLSLETVPGDETGIDSPLFGQEFTGTASLSKASLGAQPVRDLNFTFEKSGTVLTFSGGPEQSILGTIRDQGAFDISFSDPLPFVFDGTGTLQNGVIDMYVDDLTLDYSAVARFDLIPYFQMKQGLFSGDIHVSGPVNDPDFEGNVKVQDVIGGIPLIQEDFGPINTVMRFNGRDLVVEDMEFPVGIGKGGGSITFFIDHWVPRTFEIRIGTLEGTTVPIRDSFAGINIDGYGSGNVVITGDKNGVEITGSLSPTLCAVTLGDFVREKKKRQSDFDLILDLTITTGKRVEFFWPSQELPIMRASAAAGEDVIIKYNTVLDTYSVTGNIGVKGGQIYYFSRNFYLRDGFIAFNENQDKFDPRLTLRAEIFEATKEGERVKIAMVLNNNPLSQFVPRFESEPTLPDVEILAMLGQSLLTELGGEKINLTNAILFTGDIVGQFSVVRTFEDKIKKIFNLDLFSVRTRMLQNLLLEKVFGEELEPAGGGTASVGKYLDNTTILGGKYLGQDVFLELMVRLDSKNVYISNQEYFDKLEVQSEISIEWDTPVALLELTFQPSMEDMVSSLSDTSLALSWRFSF